MTENKVALNYQDLPYTKFDLKHLQCEKTRQKIPLLNYSISLILFKK